MRLHHTLGPQNETISSTNPTPHYNLIRHPSCDLGSMNELATITKVDFRAVFHALVEQIEQAYGLKVNIGPVTGSYTGQFDGKEIWVDLEKDPEEAVFILVHLFGHTVQWNLDEQLRILGLANSGATEADIPRIYQYERQASQLGLGLLERTGEFRLARWLTDCFGADWKFLAHFYRTGEKVRFEIETGRDEPLLTSIPIPRFTPQRWPPRGSF
jgi:hypothetical protein